MKHDIILIVFALGLAPLLFPFWKCETTAKVEREENGTLIQYFIDGDGYNGMGIVTYGLFPLQLLSL